jgi:CHASE2 domain-containing sensor protein/signal transduction histidine kinase
MRHSVFREWAIIFLLLVIGISAAARYGWFARIDQDAYDIALSLWARSAASDIVIVGVDESSLQRIGRWPWQRSVQATLIDKIGQYSPAAVALDIILTDTDRADSRGAQLIANAMTKTGNVVVPVIPRVESGYVMGELLPISPIREAAAALATIKSQPDTDGVLRAVFLSGGAGEAKYRFLSWEALRLSGLHRNAVEQLDAYIARERESQPLTQAEHAAVATANTWLSRDPMHIPYAGPPGHFKVISAVDVLLGEINPNALRGKIVLVGLTALDSGDQYPTPVSGSTRSMAGIEIQANILQGIIEGVRLRHNTPLGAAILALTMLSITMALYLRLSPRGSLLLVLLSISILVLLSAILFRVTMVWISPTLSILAVAVSYPLWSWRKLEGTQRYFDQELARLASEPEVVPLAASAQALNHATNAGANSAAKTSLFASDAIASRIVAVTNATERLRSLKRFVADSIESMPTAALVVDFSGRVILSNSMADRLFQQQQVPPPPLEGAALFDLLELLRPDESGDWVSILKILFDAPASRHKLDKPEEASPLTVEAKTVAPIEVERDCVVQFAPLYTNSGDTTGLIVTIADITPLRESERRRDEALRFLSHDMRSPQASIITLLEMERENPGSLPKEILLERIGKYSRRTLNLADDFLRLAKAERAKPSDFQMLDLTEILADATDEMSAVARVKLMKIVANIAPTEAWVLGDRDLLTRAVINLASNAIKYSPDGTTVTFSLTPVASFWQIDVADEGMGIAPENMSKLFMRFQRIEQAGQPKVDGIGLGLVFVKTVIERMNGEVRVRSKVAAHDGDTYNTAHGTTFSILLPAVDPDG